MFSKIRLHLKLCRPGLPDVELLSPGVLQLGAMRHGQNHLPEARDMMVCTQAPAATYRSLHPTLDHLNCHVCFASVLAHGLFLLSVTYSGAPQDDDIATVQRMMSNGGAEGEDETEDATSDNTEEAKSINDNVSTTSQTTSA
eukprot:2661300-Rhodomonas_salina.1